MYLIKTDFIITDSHYMYKARHNADRLIHTFVVNAARTFISVGR